MFVQERSAEQEDRLMVADNEVAQGLSVETVICTPSVQYIHVLIYFVNDKRFHFLLLQVTSPPSKANSSGNLSVYTESHAPISASSDQTQTLSDPVGSSSMSLTPPELESIKSEDKQR